MYACARRPRGRRPRRARGGRSRDGIRREATVLERLGQYRVDGGLVDDVAAAQDLASAARAASRAFSSPLPWRSASSS